MQMDPALREALRLGARHPDRVIEAIIRLRAPGLEVPGVRIVARFGTFATCRLTLGSVPGAHAHPDVRSLKAARQLLPQTEVRALTYQPDSPFPDPPGPSPFTGAGVVVGFVDWGLDVDHPDFVRDDGRTRLLALWDQRGGNRPTSPEPYGYGALHLREEIDAALAGPDPYRELDYHPADADPGSGSHGTHVAGIATGNGRGGGPPGVAPEADLVFVHLADRGTTGLPTLGDSVRVLEAVDFILRTAGDHPVVINLSIGQMGGQHDGTLPVEQAFDQLLAGTPGVVLVQSAGNYQRARTHARGHLTPGARRALRFVTRPADTTPNEIEIWYAGRDEFRITLHPPRPGPATTVPLGADGPIVVDGRQVGWIYHRARDPNNGDHHVDAFLAADAPAGIWTITLDAVTVRVGRYDAWIERDDACRGCQARFLPSDADRSDTLGTIATSHLPLIVGAYDDHRPDRPLAAFSSSGPTRDGRPKPDLIAPGVRILAARSAALDDRHSPGRYTVKSGTSMAAPRVAGAVARCLQAGGHLTTGQIRALLLAATEPATGADLHRTGHGRLDLDELDDMLTAGPPDARRRPTARDDQEEPMTDDFPALELSPDRIYRELRYRPDGRLARWLGNRFTLLAAHGQRLAAEPQTGDLILTVVLGRPGQGRWARITAPGTLRSGGPDGPGWYARITTLTDPDAESRCRILDTREQVTAGTVLLRPVAEADDTGDQPEPPRWSGTGEQLDFRARVLAAHLAKARAARGAPQPEPDPQDLRTIHGTDVTTSRATADAVERLLAAATTDLQAAKAAGDPDAANTLGLTVVSGYRSAEKQRSLWNQYFAARNGYYDRTRTTRAALAGGPHSDEAVAYLLALRGKGGFGLGGRIAAPGYSNHQNGIAVDLYQHRSQGHTIHNDSDDTSRARWRGTWFHHWLLAHAEEFGFRPLPTEEWHWEHRPRTGRGAAATSRAAETATGYRDGTVSTFTSDQAGLRVAVFCPKAARGQASVDVLLFAHGLLNGCSRPEDVPAGFITGPPFGLGRIVDQSGRPLVLIVPLLDWAHPGGEPTFGPRHPRWHALGSPALLNHLIEEAVRHLGNPPGTSVPDVRRLQIAAHSRAYDLLEPLVHARREPDLQRGPLATLTDVVALDTTYAGDVDAWAAWTAENPRLTVHVFYRPDSPTAAVGDRFYARRGTRLQVTQVGEGHCAVPARRIPAALGLTAPPTAGGVPSPLPAEGLAPPPAESAAPPPAESAAPPPAESAPPAPADSAAPPAAEAAA